MPADSEVAVTDTDLDAWLAEHLLGWTYSAEGGEFPHWHPIGTYDCTMDVPKLSTTGDGMLMVLEAMRSRRWYVVLYVEDDELYQASITAIDGPDDAVPVGADAEAETAPLAVAQAARAALGV